MTRLAKCVTTQFLLNSPNSTLNRQLGTLNNILFCSKNKIEIWCTDLPIDSRPQHQWANYSLCSLCLTNISHWKTINNIPFSQSKPPNETLLMDSASKRYSSYASRGGTRSVNQGRQRVFHMSRDGRCINIFPSSCDGCQQVVR